MRHSKVFIARDQTEIIATLQLATKKPWAIDMSYFSPRRKSLYLLAMAVAPEKQRQGIGADCLKQAKQIAQEWPSDAIRLDAFDADAGAGPFYARCGWRERGRVTYRGVPLIYYELLLGAEVTMRV
jgi:GNAT superfamily N-acetyltransferase